MTALRLSLRLAAFYPMALARLPGRFLAATSLARSRRALTYLDDHLLRDIGLSREDALAESRRPVWDPPAHWRD